MDKAKIMEGVRLILEGIGENLAREGLQKTPDRVAEMCEEIFGGYAETGKLSAGFPEDAGNNVVLIKDIAFYSMCEHHFLPFFGKVHILYVPQNNRMAGFSSMAKIVDAFSRRLQIQERLGAQIADAIVDALAPEGVMVTIEATQLCASMRGRHKKEMTTVTQVVRGKLPAERIQHLRNNF
ncbi:MAG: GTP cyclohydrolase I [Calditrichia bacterium]|nr:GTP cyclohydrolase I [Calditrichia bacterium]